MSTPNPGVPSDDVVNPITPDIARHVLWHYGLDGGVEPGSFVKALLSCIAVADLENRVKLGHGFMGYVIAALAVESNETGAVALQRIAQEDVL